MECASRIIWARSYLQKQIFNHFYLLWLLTYLVFFIFGVNFRICIFLVYHAFYLDWHFMSKKLHKTFSYNYFRVFHDHGHTAFFSAIISYLNTILTSTHFSPHKLIVMNSNNISLLLIENGHLRLTVLIKFERSSNSYLFYCLSLFCQYFTNNSKHLMNVYCALDTW